MHLVPLGQVHLLSLFLRRFTMAFYAFALSIWVLIIAVFKLFDFEID